MEDMWETQELEKRTKRRQGKVRAIEQSMVDQVTMAGTKDTKRDIEGKVKKDSAFKRFLGREMI